MTNEKSVYHRAFSAMVDDVEALSVERECREFELEERYIQVKFYTNDRASNHTDSSVFFHILKLTTDEKLKNTDD